MNALVERNAAAWSKAYNSGHCQDFEHHCTSDKKKCVIGAASAMSALAKELFPGDKVHPEYRQAVSDYLNSFNDKICSRARECFSKSKPINQGDRNTVSTALKESFVDLLKDVFEADVKPEQSVTLRPEFKPIFKRNKLIDIKMSLPNGTSVYFEIKYASFNDIGAALFEAAAMDKKESDRFVILGRGWTSPEAYHAYRNLVLAMKGPVDEVLDADLVCD